MPPPAWLKRPRNGDGRRKKGLPKPKGVYRRFLAFPGRPEDWRPLMSPTPNRDEAVAAMVVFEEGGRGRISLPPV